MRITRRKATIYLYAALAVLWMAAGFERDGLILTAVIYFGTQNFDV